MFKYFCLYSLQEFFYRRFAGTRRKKTEKNSYFLDIIRSHQRDTHKDGIEKDLAAVHFICFPAKYSQFKSLSNESQCKYTLNGFFQFSLKFFDFNLFIILHLILLQ